MPKNFSPFRSIGPRPHIVGLVMLLALAGTNMHAQTHHQTLYWLRYQTQITVTPSITINGEIDYRRFIDPDVANQFITHARLHYKFRRWDFASGLTYSVAFASIPENGYEDAIHELRPVVEASYEIPLGKVQLGQRLRMDNRIFQQDPDESIFDESYYVMRLRYRLQGRFPLKTNDAGITTIGMRIADEIMVNDRKNVFDQNRIYVTGEFYINKRLAFSAEYIYIYQRRYARDEYFSRNVLRLTLIQKFNLQRKA